VHRIGPGAAPDGWNGCGGSDDGEILADWMTGSFSSAAQAEADSAFFDIRLEMVRIRPDLTDATWLYVE